MLTASQIVNHLSPTCSHSISPPLDRETAVSEMCGVATPVDVVSGTCLRFLPPSCPPFCQTGHSLCSLTREASSSSYLLFNRAGIDVNMLPGRAGESKRSIRTSFDSWYWHRIRQRKPAIPVQIVLGSGEDTVPRVPTTLSSNLPALLTLSTLPLNLSPAEYKEDLPSRPEDCKRSTR